MKIWFNTNKMFEYFVYINMDTTNIWNQWDFFGQTLL